MELVIRADDLGYSRAVNYGIADSLEGGLVSSVGLMVNMPSASHGLKLIEKYHVSLGQHTNICLGRPCADPSLIPSLLDENGMFLSSRAHRQAFKEGKDLVNVDEAVIEVEAQYHRFKELTGQEPDYFEAHAIASQNLGRALQIVAEKYHLPFLQMTPVDTIGKFCGHSVNALPMHSMDQDYDPFATLQNDMQTAGREDMPDIFVCHPGYLDDDLLKHSSLTVNRTKEVAMLRDPEVKTWLDAHGAKLTGFRELREKYGF